MPRSRWQTAPLSATALRSSRAQGKAGSRIQAPRQSGNGGINIGVPASMAWFPFNGWDDSFFGDLHMQGAKACSFFTQLKVTTSRWFSYGEGSIWADK
jgi:malonate-semialdehyde dehydrogenase (acetylating)/methylmalonate-semialdehyde dehydrogenase